MDEAVPKTETTFPCKVCGRHFIRSSLEIHEPACKKLSHAHRKVFDSGKQRASGSDIPLNDVRKAAKEKEKHGGTFPRPKTTWRERHEEFIGAVKAGKEVDHALKTGGPLPPPPRTSVPSDYVHCDYCGRNFTEAAAERHIPHCREQHRNKVPTANKSGSRGSAASNKTQSTSSSKSQPVRKSTTGAGTTGNTAVAAGANRRPSRERPAGLTSGVGGMSIGGAMIGGPTGGGGGGAASRRSFDSNSHGTSAAAKGAAGTAKKSSLGTASSHLPQPAKRSSSRQSGKSSVSADSTGTKTTKKPVNTVRR